ncbi:uncharacterized protein LOC123864169 [Maniola jurtina]|uniref:uncharacterized protein LOC123864169 n=1 Tax=Maniola jurtina TaxID=191418 RepID=UPI001E687808|nr:uncharacterized protein LOC123864169 [Maniola jurtina]XP_045760412.1 uncharacterized protein LOC123864169 [Maniola jurtina]
MVNVSPVSLLLALALLHTAVIAKSHDKPSGPNCQTFSQGVQFNDTEAIGSWHLLHFRTEKTKGSGDPQCVEFFAVSEEERKNIEQLIGKYIENLNWDTLSLKMKIPCKTSDPNKTRDYYLEKLEGNGSYRTLQMPPPTAKLDITGFNRYPMRLKIIEGQYLAMMDCHEKFVFILGKQPPEGKQADNRFQKMIEMYWPEED